MAAAASSGHAGSREYMSGFGNEFATEALPGVLPERGNTPQVLSLCLASSVALRQSPLSTSSIQLLSQEQSNLLIASVS